MRHRSARRKATHWTRVSLAVLLLVILFETLLARMPSAADLPAGCADLSSSRIVRVATYTQLQSAVANAQPGDLITLADGTYNGRVSALTSGTADRRITLCGSRKAVINGGSISTGDAVSVRGSYWRFSGFSVTNAIQGVAVQGGSHNVIRNLEIYGIGQAGIHVYMLSSDNRIEGNVIHDTGRYIPEYGEGVYIGSAKGQWCNLTNCLPDTSDRNRITGNTIGPNVTAESIDVKEGSSGGVIDGNILDGSGMTTTIFWVDSWIVVQGSGYTITNNQGSNSWKNGYQSYFELNGWGHNNTWRGNTAVNIASDGYVVSVKAGAQNIIVGCDNSSPDGAKLSNVACAP